MTDGQNDGQGAFPYLSLALKRHVMLTISVCMCVLSTAKARMRMMN